MKMSPRKSGLDWSAQPLREQGGQDQAPAHVIRTRASPWRGIGVKERGAGQGSFHLSRVYTSQRVIDDFKSEAVALALPPVVTLSAKHPRHDKGDTKPSSPDDYPPPPPPYSPSPNHCDGGDRKVAGRERFSWINELLFK